MSKMQIFLIFRVQKCAFKFVQISNGKKKETPEDPVFDAHFRYTLKAKLVFIFHNSTLNMSYLICSKATVSFYFVAILMLFSQQSFHQIRKRGEEPTHDLACAATRC